MDYNDLTFARFREVNVSRSTEWGNGALGFENESDWITAITGELGELASLVKMRNRVRAGFRGNKFTPTRDDMAREAADVFTYLDLFCASQGIDLAEWVTRKFNEVSERNGFTQRL